MIPVDLTRYLLESVGCGPPLVMHDSRSCRMMDQRQSIAIHQDQSANYVVYVGA